ncbi:MAG: SMP-30/gluconolactonase/LRE family protein [Dehalococcoidia bacterium]
MTDDRRHVVRRLSRRAALRVGAQATLVGALFRTGINARRVTASAARAALQSGRIFAADSYGDAVSVYEVTDGRRAPFAQVNGGGYIGPLAVSPDGRLFTITNADHGSLFDITSGGDLSAAQPLARNLFSGGVEYVEGLTFDGNGNAYVTSGENGAQPVAKVTPGGSVSYLSPSPVNPTGPAVIGGTLYVSEGDSGSVLAYPLEGGQPAPFATGFQKASSHFSGQMAVDPRGRLILLWSTGSESGLFDISGGGDFSAQLPLVTASFRIDLNQIAIDGANNVYVAGDGEGTLNISRFSGGSFAPFEVFVDGLGDTESVAVVP